MMEDTLQPCHLLQAEINYELAIRGVVTQKGIADKRKILSRLLGKERQKGSAYHIDMQAYTVPFDVEITEVSETRLQPLYTILKAPLVRLTQLLRDLGRESITFRTELSEC